MPTEAEKMELLDQCAGCGGTGWLLEQTYGHTTPPQPDAVLVQQCDSCDRWGSDVSAAVSAAIARGPEWRAYAIGSAIAVMQAPQSDAWISEFPLVVYHKFRDQHRPHWVETFTALRAGWYEPPPEPEEETHARNQMAVHDDETPRRVTLTVDVDEAMESKMAAAIGVGINVAISNHPERLGKLPEHVVTGEAVSAAIAYFYRDDS